MVRIKIQDLKSWGQLVNILFGALAVSCVAIWNGYPLVYHDTGTYLSSSYSLSVPLDRPVFYGLFLRVARSLWVSNWTAVLAQCLVISFLLHTLLRQLKVRWPNVIIIMLCLLTSLPWLAGQLMPDIFTSCLAIALYLLVFYHAQLRRLTLLSTFACAVFAVMVHQSHLFIALGTMLFYSWRGRKVALAVVATAMLLSIVINAALGAGYFVIRNGQNFVAARMVHDGLVSQLLADRCAEKNYVLCPYQDSLRNLRGDQYLWGQNSPFAKIGGWQAEASPTLTVIFDSLRFHPKDNLVAALSSFTQQLVTFAVGDGLKAYPESASVVQNLELNAGGELGSFQLSRQQAGRLAQDADSFAPLQIGAFYLALAFLIATCRFGSLASFVLVFFATNALLCAVLSGVAARYQSRVEWLVLLAALVQLGEMLSVVPHKQLEPIYIE